MSPSQMLPARNIEGVDGEGHARSVYTDLPVLSWGMALALRADLPSTREQGLK